MNCKQFDIWVADLNPRMGTEAGKVRPVVILQTDLLNSEHPSVVICPITTNVKREAEILRVHLEKTSFGLNEASDVLIDQIRAIDKTRLVKKIGEVDRVTAARIKANVKIVLDLE